MPIKYRADHVGSLLRPRELLEARGRGMIDRLKLQPLEEKHIQRVLERQKELGLTIFTDGEFRRSNFMSDFSESVEGIEENETIPRAWQTGEEQSSVKALSVPGVVVGKIKQTKRLTQREVEFLKLHSPGDIKITLPSANQFPAIFYKKGVTDRYYPRHSDLLWDIVPVIKAEVQSLVAEGVPYVQIDAPRYSFYFDPKWREFIKSDMGLEPDDALDEAIAADNACLEGIKRTGLNLAIHLCRGNNRSQWLAEGGYDAIAEKLFGQLNVDTFLLEYDTDRAGSFEPLRFVPKGKAIVLGLVSTKVPELESERELSRRIDQASKYVPLENLALSPQCGFASVMEGNLITEDDQWRKLQLVVETAANVWRQA
ncbi:MAG: methionine synthase [Deltaproteobacteria bacterium]|nr:methionine synthase [Deltaproteobacteria bacterium]